MVETLTEAFIDTAKLVPILIAIYFLVSFFEYRLGDRMGSFVGRFSKVGPLVGAILGCLPQCGFSVMAATLYSKRLISTGTLLAVFISTSDEAIPLLLSMPDQIGIVARLLIFKVGIAIVAGFLVDLLLKQRIGIKDAVSANDTQGAIQCHQGCCAHDLCVTPYKWQALLWHPVKHALKIAGFLFAFSVVLGLGITLFGQERLGAVLLSGNIFQPVLAAFIGLIPNCLTSVFLVELFVKGTLGFGALVSGLCAAAGLGLLVLLRENKDLKDTLKVLGLLLIISILAGQGVILLG